MASSTAPSNPATAPDPPPTTTTTTSTDQPLLTDDAELDPEIDMAIDPAPPDPENPALDEALPEPREATRKDISLRDFLGKMDDYAPIVRPFPLFPFPPSSPPSSCLPLQHNISIHTLPSPSLPTYLLTYSLTQRQPPPNRSPTP